MARPRKCQGLLSAEGRFPSEPGLSLGEGLGAWLTEPLSPFPPFHLRSLAQRAAEAAPNQTGAAAREARESDGPGGWNSPGQGKVPIPLPRPGANINWGWLVTKEGWPND